MTATIEKPPTLTAEYVASLVAENLYALGVERDDEDACTSLDMAALNLITPEADELYQLITKDPEWDDLRLAIAWIPAYTAAFTVKATIAALTAPPAEALAQTRELLDELKAKLRRMIDNQKQI